MNAGARRRRAGTYQSCRYDVAIVGGGPAGLSAAIAAAAHGAQSVAVIECRRRWGWPIQCAELVPKLLTQIVPLERDAIVQPITGLRLYVGDEAIGFLRAPGFVIDRSRFEAALAGRAAQSGVALHQPATVREIEGNTALVAEGSERFTIEAAVIVGADGPNSRVHRTFAGATLDLACAIQYVLPLARPSEEAEVFLDRAYGAGYGWCFPRGEAANVGLALGFDRRRRLRAGLDDLVGRLVRAGKIAGSRPIRKTGGLIPVGGPVAATVRGPVVLAGDAAGQVHPLTGAGILTACACGQIAGETAVRAVREGGPDALNEYEARWRDLYGDYLARGLIARKRLAGADPDTFAEAVQRAWNLTRPRNEP